MNKNCLKGKDKPIAESPTTFRMQKLQNARDGHGLFNVWSVNVKTVFKNSNNGTTNA